MKTSVNEFAESLERSKPREAALVKLFEHVLEQPCEQPDVDVAFRVLVDTHGETCMAGLLPGSPSGPGVWATHHSTTEMMFWKQFLPKVRDVILEHLDGPACETVHQPF